MRSQRGDGRGDSLGCECIAWIERITGQLQEAPAVIGCSSNARTRTPREPTYCGRGRQDDLSIRGLRDCPDRLTIKCRPGCHAGSRQSPRPIENEPKSAPCARAESTIEATGSSSPMMEIVRAW